MQHVGKNKIWLGLVDYANAPDLENNTEALKSFAATLFDSMPWAARTSFEDDVPAMIAQLANPEALITRAVSCTSGPIVSDALHVRAVKRSGATTRDAAISICERYGWDDWLDPGFQRNMLARMADAAKAADRAFGYGPRGFGLLIDRI